MEFRHQFVGYCSSRDENGESTLDVSRFLLSLLLFDRFILKTLDYSEVERLIELFDYSGVITLLRSGALQLDPSRVYASGIEGNKVRTAFTEADEPTPNPRMYTITAVRIGQDADAENDLYVATEALAGLNANRRNRLTQALQSATSMHPEQVGPPATVQTHLELDRSTADLADAIGQLLENQDGEHLTEDQIRVRLHREGEIDLVIESNLESGLGLAPQVAHAVIGNALLSLARCNTSLAHMNAHSAVTGMPPDQQRFLDRKLGFLTDRFSPDDIVSNYQQVVELVGLPTLEQGAGSFSIDMDRFLDVRASRECREFREWLRGASPAEAAEAAGELTNWWRRALAMIGSTPGRVVRYAAISGLGVMNPPAGITLGALDNFFLEKVLPTSGPSTFLSRTYPSMFLPDAN